VYPFTDKNGLNVLRGIYTSIRAAIRDDANELIIKPHGIFWFKQNHEVAHIDVPVPSISYRSLFYKALKIDPLLKEYLQIMVGNAQEVKILVVKG